VLQMLLLYAVTAHSIALAPLGSHVSERREQRRHEHAGPHHHQGVRRSGFAAH
jgi:hypothetical protein